MTDEQKAQEEARKQHQARSNLLGGCLSVVAGVLVTGLCIVAIAWLVGIGLRLSGL